MKTKLLIGLAIVLTGCTSQDNQQALRSILLEKLKKSYDEQNWFVPLKNATQGLTAEQANWKDSTGNHSIGELVSHLIFWNERNLTAFRGMSMPDFSGNNEETFQFTPTTWQEALDRLDSIHSGLDETLKQATAEQLEQWSSDVANISSHNAYHTGQIIYIRKQKGWWDPEKGVK